MFKRNNLINKYLEHNKNKNVYLSGNKYTNQFVQLEINNGIPHGLFNLPVNIRAARYVSSQIKGRPRISNVLERVGPGVVIGMFCRGTPGVSKLRSGLKTVGTRTIKKGEQYYNEALALRRQIKGATMRPKTHVYKRKNIQLQTLNYGNF
jgi:hypothetical protein